MAERLEFDSHSPFELHQILTSQETTPEVKAYADLHLPEGEGPFGCVIAVNGSRGWSAHHLEHIDNWLASGLAVCQLRSFESRGVESVVENQLSVTHAMMMVDAFNVKELLDEDARIGRIGITGWSLGGTVATYAAWLPLVEKLGTPFEAHLPFYPATHMRPDVKTWSDAPMLILHGTGDDWTPIRFVEELMPQIPNATLHEYPGAHHGFDSLEPKKWLPKAIRLGKRTVRIDAKGHMSGVWKFGIRVPLNKASQRRFALAILRNRGAHVMGDATAREDAFDRANAFLLKHLS